MRFLSCCIVACGIFVAAVVGSPGALADGPPPRPVVVVDVASNAAELDATSLSEAIGVELGVDVVSVGDPRGSNASGEIRVSIDRDAGQLIVAYQGGARSIERRIDLGCDPAANKRAAVLLAGNLARDEAGDLVAALRRKAVASASPVSPPTMTTRASTAPADSDDDDWDADERLRSTLARYATADKQRRLQEGWLVLGLGAAAVGGGAFWASQMNATASPGYVIGPIGVIGAGVVASGIG